MYKTRLSFLRDRQGISKQAIANILGLDRTTYSHYEKEDIIMALRHLNTLSNYFNVSIDYLFNFTEVKRYKNIKSQIDMDLLKQRLKEFRKEHKMTQAKLGDKLGCSYGTIAGYESGRYLISTIVLYNLCFKYKISADYLLGKTNKK